MWSNISSFLAWVLQRVGLLILLLLFQGIESHARLPQDGGRTRITFTRLLELMEQPGESPLLLDGYEVRYAKDIDFPGMDDRFLNGGAAREINRDIVFNNIDFDPVFWLVLRNVTFNGYVHWIKCINLKAIFTECTFNSGFRTKDSDIGFFDFRETRLNYGFKLDRSLVLEHLSFNNSFVGIDSALYHQREGHFDAIGLGMIKDSDPALFKITGRLGEIDLRLNNTHVYLPAFLTGHRSLFVQWSDTRFSQISMVNVLVDAPLTLSYSVIEGKFKIRNCRFRDPVLLEGLAVESQNLTAEWSNISGFKLGVWDPDSARFITGNQPELIRDEHLFNDLIACYSIFYLSYKDQSNRPSSNACYKEWKDIETYYLGNVVRSGQDPSLRFTWYMNRFLKFFCDYGTNPFKSLLISGWVLLLFGFFYFVGPDYRQDENNGGIYRYLTVIREYLSCPEGLSEIYNRHRLTNNHGSRAEFLDGFNGKEIYPWALRLFSVPVFQRTWWLGRIDKMVLHSLDLIPKERYADLTGLKRTKVSFQITLLLLFLGLSSILINAFDSLTLSLNVFSTLGFGEIPVHGVLRYVAIIEGFIGWFLLSVFSVSLISQVIQ